MCCHQKTNSRVEKESENEASLRMLLKSVELDDNDHLAFYHLALQYMHVGLLNEAMVRSSPPPALPCFNKGQGGFLCPI